MDRGVFVLIGVSTLTLLLNIWVWFLPRSFMRFMRFGTNPKAADWPLQRVFSKLIEHPYYIWFPRFVFVVAMIVLIVLAYRVLIA